MKNAEVSDILNEIADYLELQDEAFKTRAYRKAASEVLAISSDIMNVWKQGKLVEIPGIGEGIANKISDYLQNGKSTYLQELKNKTPVDMESLRKIKGLGPKTIIKLYKELAIRNIDGLEDAARMGKLKKISGLGPIAARNIIEGIEFAKISSERHILGNALEIADEVISRLKQSGAGGAIEAAGSVRRMKETIRDIDIIIESAKPEAAMGSFVKMENVAKVISYGETRSSVILSNGIQVDLRVIGKKSYGAALLYFTGSKEHNIHLRRIAISKAMKLSEYGLFERKTGKKLAGSTEKEVYGRLGLSYIEPELREDNGEIEAAQKNTLPRLIGYGDLKGDLHMHTHWSHGENSVEEMAMEAKRIGHEYICITDHAGNLALTNPLDEERLIEQSKEIERANRKVEGIKILQGVEIDINADGSLKLPGKALKNLDLVIASVHSGFRDDMGKMTRRIFRAMENENVDIIGHPTGRLLLGRPAYDVDLGKVLDKAKETGTCLEINSFPKRLDLNDANVRRAVGKGVKLAINSDSHNKGFLKFISLGIATARRGWAEKDDVVNTMPVDKLLRSLK